MSYKFFKPFKVLSSDDSRLLNKVESNDCWVLVETHPDNKVARVIAWDGGAPEDQTLIRDYSWVPDILNEYYVNYEIELNQKEEEIDNLRDLLHDCVDHLEGQFDAEDNIVMIKRIRDYLNKKWDK